MKKNYRLMVPAWEKVWESKLYKVIAAAFFLILVTISPVMAADNHTLHHHLSLEFKNATLQDVLAAIENQSGFIFQYDATKVDVRQIVTIKTESGSMVEMLDQLLGQLNINYVIHDGQIELNPSGTLSELVQQSVIRGRVTDSSGATLPGVTVAIKGTTMGTITDQDGNFSLSNVPPNATLQFSFVGMTAREVIVGNQTNIEVSLEEETIGLDEVVAIGYGTMRKSDLTGAISVVSGDEISYRATANAAQALQGKVAGVQVTNSGTPGSSPIIRVRGLGSVRSDTEPLYVVDGVLTNNISFLSNNDIESLTVLKDASASAIYGVRAANGVIIITTKRGVKDRISISYSGYAGFQVPVDIMEMANAQQYIKLLNEKGEIAAAKSGGTFTPYDPANYNISTDWFDAILRDRAFATSHDVGFAGGNEKTLFSLGTGFYSQEGLMLDDLYQRINIRASLDSQVKDYMKVGFTANMSNTYATNAPNVAQDAFVAPPAVPLIDEETGNYYALTEFGDYANPMAGLAYNNNKTHGIRLVASGYLEFYLLDGLTFRSSYGVDGNFIRNRHYSPKYTLIGGTPSNEMEQLERTFTYSKDSYWDNTLTYTRELGADHNLTLMVGTSAQEQRSLWMSAARLGVPYYGRSTTLYLNLGSPDSQTNNDGGSRIASSSYFGRVNYSFRDRYLLTATLRRDGSSIFPQDNRFDIFPSIGLGWVLSQEDFMSDQTIFDNLKLRASWGEMGNNRIPELTSVSTVDYGSANTTEFGGILAQGASATYIGPPNLLWEKTQEYDLAVEGALLNSRLSFEMDYYHKKTIGAIFPVTVNSALGASNTSYLDNNADVVNRGVEISLTWKNTMGELSYRVGGNVAFNHNEVTDLKPGTIGIYGGYMNVNASTYTTVGHPIGEFYGRQVLGIFQNETEILQYTGADDTPIQPNAQPGDFKYLDVNGDGVINDKDRTFLGSALPTYNFALNYYVAFKGIDFQLDIYGQGGNHIYNAKRFRQIGNENYDKDFYDNRWHGEGTSTSYPSADMASNDNKVVNSWTIEKGNFIRIQNIQLGYTIPESLTSSLGIGSVRVYANAANPVTFFKYKGFTPEIAKTGPESATSQGVDSFVYPMSATYNFGVNINF